MEAAGICACQDVGKYKVSEIMNQRPQGISSKRLIQEFVYHDDESAIGLIGPTRCGKTRLLQDVRATAGDAATFKEVGSLPELRTLVQGLEAPLFTYTDPADHWSDADLLSGIDVAEDTDHMVYVFSLRKDRPALDAKVASGTLKIISGWD